MSNFVNFCVVLFFHSRVKLARTKEVMLNFIAFFTACSEFASIEKPQSSIFDVVASCSVSKSTGTLTWEGLY